MSEEWRGVARVSNEYPPWLVERTPYQKCPNCGRFAYREMYDGRVEESYGKCGECQYRDDSVSVEPDRYVHDANMALADTLLVVFALLVVVAFLWFVYQGVVMFL